MNNIEVRNFNLELRAEGEGNTIAGYAAVFDKPFENEYFIEYVRPGAFSRALREGQDVLGLFNHDANHPLGRMSAGTMRLVEDVTGLLYDIDLPDRQDAKDLRTSIKRKDIKGSSFTFRAVKVEWDESKPKPVRYLIDVDIYDVGPVTRAAYDDTTVAMRSLEMWRAEHKPQPPIKTAPLSLFVARQRQAIALGALIA
ncbi:MAG TPA: HK97 family phage prohead protease, partial [Tepidisphaeraceae bacterium]|nr:HK97 family phage prohead protease [Tepidisphaeraceae bacterium]